MLYLLRYLGIPATSPDARRSAVQCNVVHPEVRASELARRCQLPGSSGIMVADFDKTILPSFTDDFTPACRTSGIHYF